MKKLILGVFGAAALMAAAPAHAETTECTEITAVPMVITVQGVYCLKQNFSSAATSGSLIDIQVNNVTIDFNGFKLGGLAAGASTNARGVFAQDRSNIVVRNGSVRGFRYGVWLAGDAATSSGHLIEDMILDGNVYTSIFAQGTGMVVRNNRIVNTGPGGISSSANAIAVTEASNSLITGNFISKLNETNSTNGIYLAYSSLLEISDNTVLEAEGATNNRGIRLSDATDTTIIDNRVLNPAGTGTTGIQVDGASSGINCIGNTVAGFTTAISGCDHPADNHTP